ncbi:MAG TPA: hypothetical protein VLM40_02255 [Gemmata sp.]|nr:hypothetical protein [Gemmata sp.]
MAELYMTMAEIEAKYPNEWVLLAHATTRRGSQEITGGRVVINCPDRAEFLRRVGEWTGDAGSLGAVQYIGVFPEEDEHVLPADTSSGAA